MEEFKYKRPNFKTQLLLLLQQSNNLKSQAQKLRMLAIYNLQLAEFHHRNVWVHQRRSFILRALLLKRLPTTKKELLTPEKFKSDLWEKHVPLMDNTSYKKMFKISRQTMNSLVDAIAYVKMEPIDVKEPIDLAKQIAVAVFSLTTGERYKIIGAKFGISQATVRQIVLMFVNVMCDKLQNIFLNKYPPTERRVRDLCDEFKIHHKIPHCLGVIDSHHFHILVQSKEGTDGQKRFLNSEQWTSIIMMCAIDHLGRFTYINVGAPGSKQIADIFDKSALNLQLHNNPLFEGHHFKFNNVLITPYVIGNEEIPMSRFVMKPYPITEELNSGQLAFNDCIQSCQQISKTAIDQLTARFCKINFLQNIEVKTAIKCIRACCVLHNMCVHFKDDVWLDWLGEFKLDQPRSSVTDSANVRAIMKRNALSTYFDTIK